MSDSLDDFFAKKDKKKKGKSKITNNDLMTAEEESKKKKTKKKTKESTEATPSGNPEPASEKPPAADTEEWSEYVEEKEADYSGLRIHTIQIRDEDQEQGEKDKDKVQDGDEEESEEAAEAASGPWAQVPQPSVPQEQKVEPPKEDPLPMPNVKAGRYVIPSQRNAAAADPVPRSYRRKKEAPNLKSEEDFPTLGGAPPEDAGGAWGSGARFEKVKSGGRQMDEATSRGPRLELGNKYDALRGGTD